MTPYTRECEVAIAAIREASLLCQSVQAEITPGVLQKKDRSPVTVADFGSQSIVCKHLFEAFPNDPIIGEEDSHSLKQPENQELLSKLVVHVQKYYPHTDPQTICDWIDRGSATQYSERFWTLDPIDGTKGFLRGEQYAVSLALVEKGKIVFGVLGCPNILNDPADSASKGAIFYATKGQGSFSIPLTGNAEPKQISISTQTNSSLIRFCESVEKAHSSHDDAARLAEELGITVDSVRLDSQAKYAVVGRGEAECYLRLPRTADYNERIWDHGGGVIVIEEAGGKVTDVFGNSLDFSQGKTLSKNTGVIATNGHVHDAVIRAIKNLKIGVF